MPTIPAHVTPTEAILEVALKMTGAAGLSSLDAYAWRRLCCSFHSASQLGPVYRPCSCEEVHLYLQYQPEPYGCPSLHADSE